jgi:hypothetical protein
MLSLKVKWFSFVIDFIHQEFWLGNEYQSEAIDYKNSKQDTSTFSYSEYGVANIILISNTSNIVDLEKTNFRIFTWI